MRVILIVTALASLVAGACFAFSGTALEGAILATRFSARVSGVVLALAVVARAPRPMAPLRADLTQAFAAAHGVHYTTVIVRAVVEESHLLRHPDLRNVFGVLGGGALIVTIAATARAAALSLARLNAAALYIAWAILALASASRFRTSLPSVTVLVLLLLAMLWRLSASIVHPEN